MNDTLNSVLGAWSWSQVLIGLVIVALIGSIGCFRIDAWHRGYEEGLRAGRGDRD